MEYNTTRDRLIIPEYGRNIQNLIKNAVLIEDREKRNKMARAIISVMGHLNPHLRDVNDFKHKLWDHLFIMSDFKLDVDSPFEKPTPQSFQTKPQKVPYPVNNIKFKSYGKLIEFIIDKIAEMEDGPKKEALIGLIFNYLKRNYTNYNREFVIDNVINEHIKILSDGKINLLAKEEIIDTETDSNNNNTIDS
ncbi:MAG: DUF4290 domain-containing protein [Bacteroidota bacterium]|nr:DUF4290 domain-containing protein [Bacteroidota bacterium]